MSLDTSYVLVSEDTTNRNQSWCYTTILKTRGTAVRVDIRANAYEDQSYAKVEVWSDEQGWMFHASIPTEIWYAAAPSYTKRDLDASDFITFHDLRDELLDRLTRALWATISAEDRNLSQAW